MPARKTASEPLVNVQHPSIDIDLVYATESNFTGTKLYADSRALLHKEAAAALYRAAGLAAAAQLRIRLYDAFRPSFVQQKLWAIRPDPRYVADPEVGSDHTRGIAVDVTLSDMSGQCLDMGTDFDVASVNSHHGPVQIGNDAHRNRLMLVGIMTVAGFVFNPQEWWHYSLPDNKAYQLI